MKFKYTGRKMGNIQFAIAGIIGMGECLQNGETYDVPDDNKELIKGCELHPHFEKVTAIKKVAKKEEKGE